MVIMEMRKRNGYVTIVFSLIFVVILSLMMTLIESMEFYTAKAGAYRALNMGVQSMLSSYTTPLMESYGLFAVDMYDEEQKLAIVREYTSLNLGRDGENKRIGRQVTNLEDLVLLSQKGLLDEDCKGLKEAIVTFSKYYFAGEGIQKGLEKINPSILAAKDKEMVSGDIESTESAREYAEQVPIQEEGEGEGQKEAQGMEDSENEEEREEVKDPREILDTLLSEGILALALPSGYEVSQKKLDAENLSVIAEEEKFIDGLNGFTMLKNIGSQLAAADLDDFGEVLSKPLESYLLNKYSMEFFSNALQKENESGISQRVLDYETEYMIEGHLEDQKNLESILNRIIMIRTLMNIGYLYSDSVKLEEAQLLAVAIAAVTALPAIVEAVKLMILLTWSYAEAIVDCRVLMAGNKLCVFKSSQTWNLSMEHLQNLTFDEIEKNAVSIDENGIDYEGYLSMFLLTSNENRHYVRLAGIIESNLSKIHGYEDFRMSSAVYSADVEGTFDIQCSYGLSMIKNLERSGEYRTHQMLEYQ